MTTTRIEREREAYEAACRGERIMLPGEVPCPDCGGPMPKRYIALGYHCNACTRALESGAS